MAIIYIFLFTGFESIKSIYNDYNHKGRAKTSGTGMRPSGLEIWKGCTVDIVFYKLEIILEPCFKNGEIQFESMM